MRSGLTLVALDEDARAFLDKGLGIGKVLLEFGRVGSINLNRARTAIAIEPRVGGDIPLIVNDLLKTCNAAPKCKDMGGSGERDAFLSIS